MNAFKRKTFQDLHRIISCKCHVKDLPADVTKCNYNRSKCWTFQHSWFISTQCFRFSINSWLLASSYKKHPVYSYDGDRAPRIFMSSLQQPSLPPVFEITWFSVSRRGMATPFGQKRTQPSAINVFAVISFKLLRVDNVKMTACLMWRHFYFQSKSQRHAQLPLLFTVLPVWQHTPLFHSLL